MKTTTNSIRWNRSADGYAKSKCGTYSIEAQFCGCVRAQSYALYARKADGASERVASWVDTQAECKEWAQSHADQIALDAAAVVGADTIAALRLQVERLGDDVLRQTEKADQFNREIKRLHECLKNANASGEIIRHRAVCDSIGRDLFVRNVSVDVGSCRPFFVWQSVVRYIDEQKAVEYVVEGFDQARKSFAAAVANREPVSALKSAEDALSALRAEEGVEAVEYDSKSGSVSVYLAPSYWLGSLTEFRADTAERAVEIMNGKVTQIEQ